MARFLDHQFRAAAEVPAAVSFEEHYGVGTDFAFFHSAQFDVERVSAALTGHSRTLKDSVLSSEIRLNGVAPFGCDWKLVLIIIGIEPHRQAQLFEIVAALDIFNILELSGPSFGFGERRQKQSRHDWNHQQQGDTGKAEADNSHHVAAQSAVALAYFV